MLSATAERIADQLAGRAAAESLTIESAQTQEWHRSIDVLQRNLDERVPMIRELLSGAGSESIRHSFWDRARPSTGSESLNTANKLAINISDPEIRVNLLWRQKKRFWNRSRRYASEPQHERHRMQR